MSQVDITEGIPKQIDAFCCKGCGRYLSPPNYWLTAELESKELLTYCLKRIRGLNKVNLVDAGFVWTEPHSKRLKVKLKIQKQVFNGTIIQQDFIVEVIVQNHFCEDCHRSEAKDTWNAVAQVRQKVAHKRTFLWIEQMIIKHKYQKNILSIKEEADGLDFYFNSQNTCVKFINFLQSFVPVTFKQSKQLMGADLKSNVYNYKFTYSVEIPPISRDDLVCLPTKLAQQLGNISPLVLCLKVTNCLYFLDPFTLQIGELSEPARYWAYGFKSISSRNSLIEYMIIDIDIIQYKGKYALAEATVAKVDTMGTNNKTYFTVTHLGNILNVGDTVLGYDLENSNFNDSDITSMKNRVVRSEVILVKKHYPRKMRPRHWKLGNLEIDTGDNKDKKSKLRTAERENEEFMRDIEEDVEMRGQITLYKTGVSAPPESDMEDENELPPIPIDELTDMVDDLQLAGDDDEDEVDDEE
jgi:nonsense-mediated mRNA decay protein 3